MEHQSIEQKEIRGVTIKTIWTVVTSTAVMIVFLLNIYQAILSKIDIVNESVREGNTANKIQDLQIKELQVRVEKLEDEFEKIRDERINRQ